jgi:hypothetical protein
MFPVAELPEPDTRQESYRCDCEAPEVRDALRPSVTSPTTFTPNKNLTSRRFWPCFVRSCGHGIPFPRETHAGRLGHDRHRRPSAHPSPSDGFDLRMAPRGGLRVPCGRQLSPSSFPAQLRIAQSWQAAHSASLPEFGFVRYNNARPSTAGSQAVPGAPPGT